jgi:hypothetical protein
MNSVFFIGPFLEARQAGRVRFDETSPHPIRQKYGSLPVLSGAQQIGYKKLTLSVSRDRAANSVDRHLFRRMPGYCPSHPGQLSQSEGSQGDFDVAYGDVEVRPLTHEVAGNASQPDHNDVRGITGVFC